MDVVSMMLASFRVPSLLGSSHERPAKACLLIQLSDILLPVEVAVV